MVEIIAQTISLLIIFFIGYALKRVGFLGPKDGNTLFKLIFYIGAPALILHTVPSLALSLELIWFMLLPALVIAATLGATLLLKKAGLITLPKQTFSTLAIGVIILNTGFLIPFVEQFYGNEGLAHLMIIDAFNALFTFSLVYIVAIKFSRDVANKKYMLQKLAAAPPLWALALAGLLAITNTSLPAGLDPVVGFVAGLVSPLILLALGLKFSLILTRPKLTALALGLRFALGGIIGLTIVWLAGFDGLKAHIILLASMAPIGFNSLVFAETKRLDTRYAAAQISAGVIIGILLLPLLIYGLGFMFPL